jgi:hypothetical protein
MYPIVFFIIGIAAAIIKIAVTKKQMTGSEKAGVFLLYLIVMCIGVEGIFAFLGHAFIPDKIAEQIGWPTGSPFQFEIAIANLSYGVLGFLCILFRGRFWMAVVIGNSIFLWGAAYGHFVQMLKGDRSPYNSGIFLYAGDIIIPLIIFVLMIYYFRSQRKTTDLENN